MDSKKIYKTTIVLGQETDTLDLTGTVIRRNDKQITLNKKLIEVVINKYIGDYKQIPPYYSAKKINGIKLYDLARKNIFIRMKPNVVKIFNIELNNSIITTFNIACSSEKKESKLWFHDINKTGGSSILSNEDREYIKYDKSTLTFETVQTNTLDNMLTNISNNIILVKIDVERHELDVLKGGKIFFSNNKILLQIEIFQELKNRVFKYLIDQKFRYINSIDDDHYFTNY